MRIAYSAIGNGPPLALVSGLAQTGERWRRVRPHLEEKYRVFTFDNRDTGITGRYQGAYTIEDMALDILDTLDAAEVDTFFIAGVSMGGMIAQEVVRLAPERVGAAAFISTNGGRSVAIPPGPDAAAILRPRVPTKDPDGRKAAVVEMWTLLTGPGFADEYPEVIEEEAELTLEANTPVEGIQRQLMAIADFDPEGVIAEENVPFLVIHGDRDPLIPFENGIRLSEQLRCRIVCLEGAGHAVEIERPTALADLLDNHFSAASTRHAGGVR